MFLSCCVYPFFCPFVLMCRGATLLFYNSCSLLEKIGSPRLGNPRLALSGRHHLLLLLLSLFSCAISLIVALPLLSFPYFHSLVTRTHTHKTHTQTVTSSHYYSNSAHRYFLPAFFAPHFIPSSIFFSLSFSTHAFMNEYTSSLILSD